MSNPLPFDSEEADLLAKLEEIRKKKEAYLASWQEALDIEAANIPLVFGMYQIQGILLYMEANRELDVSTKAELNKIGTQVYGNKVIVNAKSWPKFKDIVTTAQIKFKDDVLKNRFLTLLKGPHYQIKLGATKKHIEIIVTSSIAESAIFYGAKVSYLDTLQYTGDTKYRTEISDGHVLFTSMKSNMIALNIPENWIQWDKDVLDIIQKDIEKRELVDKIALMEDCPEFDPKFPTGLSLKPFQRVGARFLEVASKGILGHQPGLGKSPMAISVAYKEQDYTLVVCPASLRLNWSKQIFKFTGEHATILKGEFPSEYTANLVIKEKPTKWIICSYDTIAASKKMIREVMENGIKKKKEFVIYPWAALLSIAGFDRVIIDEAHYMKNPTAARSQGMMSLINIPKSSILTGTPLINRPREAFTLLRFLNPDLFNNYEGFVRRWEYSNGTCTDNKAFKELLKPYMLRKLTSEVQKDLEPINRIDIEHEMSDAAMIRYNEALKGLYIAINKLTGEVTNEMNITSILAEFVRLKQICSDDKIDQAAEMAMNYYDETGNKMIVFSQFVGTCDAINRKLGGEGVLITGEIPFEERQKLVEQFQTDPNVHFAVCSSMAVREGLDMDAAMATMFVDPLWAPAYYEQCEGRAYGRLSNPHPINSYYLNAAGTIEDMIADIRLRKFNMIAGTVDDINSVRNSSMAGELIKALKMEINKKAWGK